MMSDAAALKDYANSLDSGYLKSWKASSMMMSLPHIMSDNIRLLEYLDNCLSMEGFSGFDLEKIQRWVIENVESL